MSTPWFSNGLFIFWAYDCLISVKQLWADIMRSIWLTRQMYEFDKEHGGQGAWTRNVKSICASIGKLDNWCKNRCVNIKNAREKLMEAYIAVWKTEITCRPKLELYRSIKHEYSTANFVTANISKLEKSLIAQILNGSLPIGVECGRYSQIPRNCRICDICGGGLEDELHFLFKCSTYEKPRHELFKKLPELNDIVEDVKKLETLCNMLHKMGHYIKRIWEMRNEHVKIETIF